MSIKQRAGIFVAGESREAVAAALNESGIPTVTSQAQAGATVIAQSGATPARTLAMQALGMGQSIISANPLLWALCGQQLATIAQSQKLWLGLEGALLGTTPLAPYLANPPAQLTAVFTGAADNLLQRLTHFGESPISAEAQLRLLRQDMSDLHGKQSAARAAILGALAYGNWNLPTARTGLDAITQADVAWLNRQGLTLRYTVSISAQGITAAPTAIGQDSPFATLQGSLVADDLAAPASLFAATANEAQRAHAGLLADIKLWAQRATWGTATPFKTPYQTPAVTPASAAFYVRSPALFRAEIIAKNQVVSESFGAGNQWQALLTGARPNNAEVFVLPVQMPETQAFRRATA